MRKPDSAVRVLRGLGMHWQESGFLDFAIALEAAPAMLAKLAASVQRLQPGAETAATSLTAPPPTRSRCCPSYPWLRPPSPQVTHGLLIAARLDADLLGRRWQGPGEVLQCEQIF